MNQYEKAVVAARADFENYAKTAASGSEAERICASILADYSENGNGLLPAYFQDRLAELAKVAGEGQQELVQSAERLRQAAQDNEDYF